MGDDQDSEKKATGAGFFDAEESENPEGGLGGRLGDAFKKIVTVGLTGAFVAEETLRAYLGELKLPKEVINGLIQSAVRSKEEMASKITKEVMNMVGKIDLSKEVSKFLEGHSMKVSAEIEFIKKDDKKEDSK